jgi:hypothetical protein
VPVGLTVSVAGTAVSSPVNPSGQFTLQGVPSGHVELQFSGPGINARLSLENVPEHAEIRITVRVSGSTAQLDDEHAESPDNHVEIEGLVTTVTCPTGLQVNQTLLILTGQTVFRHGGTILGCIALHPGDRVHVKATRNGATLTATEVKLQNDQLDDDDHDTETDDDDDSSRAGSTSGSNHGGDSGKKGEDGDRDSRTGNGKK